MTRQVHSVSVQLRRKPDWRDGVRDVRRHTRCEGGSRCADAKVEPDDDDESSSELRFCAKSGIGDVSVSGDGDSALSERASDVIRRTTHHRRARDVIRRATATAVRCRTRPWDDLKGRAVGLTLAVSLAFSSTLGRTPGCTNSLDSAEFSTIPRGGIAMDAKTRATVSRVKMACPCILCNICSTLNKL